MDEEIPGVLRPTGGTKRFRENCRLVAEEGFIVVTDRNGKTTRFPSDGSQDAPKEMMTYLHDEDFIILDGNGRGIIASPYVLWDAHESAAFCELAHIEDSVTNTYSPAPLRPDGVRLEEPAWLRRYVVSAPYVFAAGVALAAFGRALDLPVWLMLPFIPWLLMFPVVRATGYFAPQRVGPADIAFQERVAKRAAAEARKSRKRKTTSP
jgi:hypothetical protein